MLKNLSKALKLIDDLYWAAIYMIRIRWVFILGSQSWSRAQSVNHGNARIGFFFKKPRPLATLLLIIK